MDAGQYPDGVSPPRTAAARAARRACGVDDERIETFGLLLEAHARLTRLLDTEMRASDGISLQTFEVLLRIGRAPEGHVSMSELAAAVALTTGGVTRLADRLEAEGLVERRSCPEDRRVVHLALTPAGEHVLERALGHHLEGLETHVTSRIPAEDLARFRRVLEILRSPPADPAP